MARLLITMLALLFPVLILCASCAKYTSVYPADEQDEYSAPEAP